MQNACSTSFTKLILYEREKGGSITALTWFFMFMAFTPVCLHAAGLSLKHRWEISGVVQHRELNQESFSELKNQTDAFLLIGLDQSLKFQPWFFEVRPELRLLSSPGLNTPSQDISRPQIIDSSRALSLSHRISPSQEDARSGSQVVTDIEKLNLRYQGSTTEFILGRNPFNPSILRLSPVWNKFSRDIFSQSYPNIQFNPDMTSLKLSMDRFWLQNANVLARETSQNSYLLLAGVNFESVELQGLAGQVFDQPAVGANFNISVSDSLLKAEWMSVNGRAGTRTKHNEVGVGFERSWTDSFATVTEFYYSDISNEFADSTDITLGQSRFTSLRSKYYFINQLEYQINQTWQFILTPVFNLSDSSYVFMGSLRWNILSNLDGTLTARYGGGEEGSEFSARSVRFTDGSYVGYSNTVSLMLKCFF